MNLERYLKYRHWWEPALWASFFLLNCIANIAVVWMDQNRVASELPLWEPVVWEGSSALVSLVLLFAILAFDRHFPIQRLQLIHRLCAHLLFTVPFSLAHVLGMVGLRKVIYQFVGQHYDFGNWPTELGYEYLKDFRSYVYILGFVYLYRFVIRRLRGEAELLTQGREEYEPEPVTDRFLVKKLGREFLVRMQDIDWIEAAGNYVNLHVGERVYPLRETMTVMDVRLATHGFLRVHRSAIVNLDRVSEIVPYDTGDAQIRLDSTQQVPVSRRYRKMLRERVLG